MSKHRHVLVNGVIGLALALLVLPAQAANPRLESIKQTALALYSVSLAESQQFSETAAVVLSNAADGAMIEQLALSIDGELVTRYHYGRAPLRSGQAHQLGTYQLDFGRHRVEVTMTFQRAGQRKRLQQGQTLKLDEWPRSLRVTLNADADALEFDSPATSDEWLAAARYELSIAQTARALTLLQNLAHFDQARALAPEFLDLMGHALNEWELPRAAEQTYLQLSQLRNIDGRERAQARLHAAELALRRGDLQAAEAHINASEPWPRHVRRQGQTARARLLAARGELQAASQLMPEDAAPIWRYNLAAMQIQQGDINTGLNRLSTLARDDNLGPLQDTALLKLGYLYLSQNDAERAAQAFSAVSGGSPEQLGAVLGRGWAALTGIAKPFPVNSTASRPAFAQRIEASLRQGSDSRQQRAALHAALKHWTPLLQQDPLLAPVQEAHAGIAFALAELGDHQRAASYARRGIRKMDLVRRQLRKAERQQISQDLVELDQLTAEAWPPAPGRWARFLPRDRWWQDEDGTPPDRAFMPQLLQDPHTLRAMRAMSTLRDAEAMTRTASRDPDLRLRTDRLLKQIGQERQVQQAALNRQVASWLQSETDRTSNYLIMTRLVLAYADAQLREEKR